VNKAGFPILLLILLVPSALLRAQWYDSYEKGRKAVERGQWQQAVSRLTEALDDESNSKANKKTYGFVFIDYFPYLYRGIAYYRLGDMVNARADLEKAKNEGAIEDAQRDKEAPTLLAEYVGLLQKPSPQTAQQKPVQNPPLNPSSGALQPDLKKSDLKKSDLKKPETAAADQKQKQKLVAAVSVHPAEIPAATTHEPARTGKASAPDTAGSALFREAVALFNDGKIGQAKARFQTLQTIAPSYPELANYMGSISSVEDMVHQGIAAFFGGEYRDAIDKLSSSSKRGNDNPHVYAFLACSYAAEYLLAGAENGNLKKEAVDAFGKVRGIDPRYELDTNLISPGIIALLSGE
jgi:tetratricopeptide (TPR) repeat protein